MENLQYPIGRLTYNPEYTQSELVEKIATIKNFPQRVKAIAATMSEAKLDTPYRPEGWTARQVIHHCADSHMNAYIRFRWALTEDNPTIKAYFEDRWAQMADYAQLVESSIALLEGLHARWISVIDNLTATDMPKSVFHPEAQRYITIKELINMYDWHCRHHLGHLQIVANK